MKMFKVDYIDNEQSVFAPIFNNPGQIIEYSGQALESLVANLKIVYPRMMPVCTGKLYAMPQPDGGFVWTEDERFNEYPSTAMPLFEVVNRELRVKQG